MNTTDRVQRQVKQLLGHPVHFVLDDDHCVIRAWTNHNGDTRWLTATEWRVLFRNGLVGCKAMQPAPDRGDQEHECPCPGCGHCACPWVGDGSKQCRGKRCVCPRTRRPVRLRLRRVSFRRVALELRRGDRVLASLGEWTPLKGWDFSRAGEAKARSLPAIIEALIAREARHWTEVNELQADFDELQADLATPEAAAIDEPPAMGLEPPADLEVPEAAGVAMPEAA